MRNIKKRNVRFILLIAIIISLLTTPLIASAYTLQPYKLDKSKTLNFVPHSGFGSTSVSHFNEALWEWNSESGYTLMTRSASTTHNKTDYPNNDGNNYIYRVNAGSGYVAQCTTYYNSSTGIASSSDININMYYAWANSAQPGAYDVWSVFLHESGHTAGLGHSSISSAVMYKSISTNTTKRYLTTDDKLGINSLY